MRRSRIARFELFAVLLAAIVAALPRPAAATDIVTDLTALGTTNGYLSVTANCGTSLSTPSGNNVELSNTGFGHTGGLSAQSIDSGESVAILSLADRRGVAYRVAAAGNEDGDGLVGEGFLEAFDEGGSLGVVPVAGVGRIDVSALFGGAAIHDFRITSVESIRISQAIRQLGSNEGIRVDLTPYSSRTFASFTQCSVDFDSEDGSVVLEPALGLGIVGAASGRIDAGETLRVEFPVAVAGVEYELRDSTDVGGSFQPGDHFVEAFDAQGASLGLRSASDDGDPVDLGAAYGDALLSGFDLIGVNDSFRVSAVRFVPEPGATQSVAALVALAVAGVRRSRRA